MEKSNDDNGRHFCNASFDGNIASVTRLCESKYIGAFINWKKKNGESPLFIASQNGHIEVATLLLANGADVNQDDKYGWSPLSIASQQGHVEVTTLLLANGADVNQPTDEWDIPTSMYEVE
ncbi:Aste57867_2175 [Aphanomyces stellatus]|uniref:Aste57867_2175 protein n=1 Tax=Aphanomyces stellatus TaxID=120398 RepID=A0A485KAP1_9STRA|nr:hypothetical protein As57867_002170 [Aphanomyces stellatus]VFT79378.1 Aste57867_2175 [Aphanomyces stellatus]